MQKGKGTSGQPVWQEVKKSSARPFYTLLGSSQGMGSPLSPPPHKVPGVASF